MKLLKFVAVLFILSTSPTVALANQDTEAKAAYKKGRELFKAGQYAQAAVQLQKAYTLKPHPMLLKYLGDTYYKIKEPQLALDHYQRYLKEAPQAADREQVEAKIAELSSHGGKKGSKTVAAPPPAAKASTDKTAKKGAPAAPATPPAAAPVPPAGEEHQPSNTEPSGNEVQDLTANSDAPDETISPTLELSPTGEDREVPVALDKKAQQTTMQQKPHSRALSFFKWTTLGLGAAGMVAGLVANRLAASNADDLQKAVKTSCPSDDTTCLGNPDMDSPVIAFNKSHYDMQQAYKRYNLLSTVSFITGGVLLGTSAVLFYFDYRGRESSKPGSAAPTKATSDSTFSFMPMFAPGFAGASGAFSF